MKKKFKPTQKTKSTQSNFLDIKDPLFQMNFTLKEIPNYNDNIWNVNASRIFEIKPIGTTIEWNKDEN